MECGTDSALSEMLRTEHAQWAVQTYRTILCKLRSLLSLCRSRGRPRYAHTPSLNVYLYLVITHNLIMNKMHAHRDCTTACHSSLRSESVGGA